MKAFRFRLQRVLDLRNLQLKTEETKLEQLIRQCEEKQAQWKMRQASLNEAYSANRSSSYLHSSELVALGHFSRRIERECRQLTAGIEADAKLVAQQRAAVVQARSRVRLLEKLKEQRRTEWQAESERELETLAGEFSAAQWLREKRQNSEKPVPMSNEVTVL